MRTYADAVFVLDKVDKDGVSLRDKYEQVEKATGVRPPELDHAGELPEPAADAWAKWQDMRRLATVVEGRRTITWADVEIWQRVRLIELTPTELEMITVIENKSIEVANRKE